MKARKFNQKKVNLGSVESTELPNSCCSRRHRKDTASAGEKGMRKRPNLTILPQLGAAAQKPRISPYMILRASLSLPARQATGRCAERENSRGGPSGMQTGTNRRTYRLCQWEFSGSRAKAALRTAEE